MANQYYGPYRGVVTDNNDPNDLMRIRARVPEVLGETETSWALPCVPPGVRSVPDIDSLVWIMFEAGDPSRPIWVGTAGVAESGVDGDK